MIKTENNSAKYIYAYIAILKNMIIMRRKKIKLQEVWRIHK